jgi:hypothetical protein
MKSLLKIVSFSFVVLIAITAISCSNDKVSENSEVAISDEVSTNISTRSLSMKVASKAYYYKSIATFAQGTATLSLDNIASLTGKKVNLVLLYEADAPWAVVFNSGKYNTTGDDRLNGLMESYELSIVKQFSIDEENEGIVLEANTELENPTEAARELSMIENVLMVHVKEIPSVEEDIIEESAPNN